MYIATSYKRYSTVLRGLWLFAYRFVEILKRVMQHNFFPTLIMCAGAVLALHYTAVVKSAGCPIVVAEGPSHTGKSTSFSVGLAFLGMVM